MAWEDSEAIFKAYPTVEKINHDGEKPGCYDASDNLVTIDQSLVDAARTEIDKTKYQIDRVGGKGDVKVGTYYAEIGDQLDLLWHAIDADADLKSKFSAFYNSIKAVKDANPKP